jgi:hypothetical protein
MERQRGEREIAENAKNAERRYESDKIRLMIFLFSVSL